MSISLPGFDSWLTERLEECAGDSGEHVETYVARAVAAQMINDCERADGASANKLKARLSQSGLSGETVSDGIASVLADPRRLRALNATGLWDTPPDNTYSRITRTAADALGTPAAALVLIGADRQFVKAVHGVHPMTAPERCEDLDESFDKYVVVNGSLVRVDDARHHPLFKKYAAVRDGRITSYLGVPLSDSAGNAVAVLRVTDSAVRRWSPGHLQILEDLAGVVTARMFGA